MTNFQWIGLAFLVLLAGVNLVRVARDRSHWRSKAFWIVLWSLAGVAIAFPELTSIPARFLGIGRGADLVFYCAILGTMYGFFLIFMRLREMDERMTQLIREIAILESEKNDR